MFARARPEYILVEERLAYDQEISRNSSSWLRSQPTGCIRISVPYDGGTSFGRDASDDVTKALRDDRSVHEAVIGHLVFVEQEETDLDDVLGLNGTFRPYPLRVPIRSAVLRDVETLTADKFTYYKDITYRPPAEGPKVIPLKVIVDLFDPGHQDGTFLAESVVDKVRRNVGLRRVVANMIRESAEFQPYLTALINVRLNLPPRKPSDTPIAAPTVRSVRVTLPDGATLSPSSVRILDGTRDDARELPLQMDARSGSFEWLGGPMAIDAADEDAPRVYVANPVQVQFQQPGELFRQREIRVDVEVELPHELTSGAQVRYFGATGEAPRRGAATPLAVRTIISARCAVLLHDAFSQRRISPSQSFCFDEIVPDEQRVGDVVAALTDQRFLIELQEPLDSAGKKRIEHLIIATRRDGPRTMQLWVYVDGRRQPTEREARHPWGHRYRSKFDSGTLKLHVRGLVHGDARGVTREINALHLALHDRFQRMKALR